MASIGFAGKPDCVLHRRVCRPLRLRVAHLSVWTRPGKLCVRRVGPTRGRSSLPRCVRPQAADDDCRPRSRDRAVGSQRLGDSALRRWLDRRHCSCDRRHRPGALAPSRRCARGRVGVSLPLLPNRLLEHRANGRLDGAPSAAAIWAALRGGRALQQGTGAAIRWWLIAGLLAGTAALFKYTAVAIGLPLVVVLGWVAVAHDRRAWLGLPSLVGGGAAALAACWIWLSIIGAWSAFVNSQLGLVAPYVEKRAYSDTLGQALNRLFVIRGLRAELLPLLWAAPLALPAAIAATWEGRKPWLALSAVLTWWLIALANVAAQGKLFDYHYLPLTAPTALVVGLGAAWAASATRTRFPRRKLRTLAALLSIAALIGATPLGGKIRDVVSVAAGVQSVEEYIRSRREYRFPAYDVEEIRNVAKLVQDTTARSQRVFVWALEPTINVRAQRRTVSRFIYNYPFRASVHSRTREYGAELLQALGVRPPDVFVVGSRDRFPGFTGTHKDSKMLLRELDSFLDERHRPAETVGRYALWRLDRRTPAAP